MDKFNVKKFLKEHGPVTDKNEAIELLCKTNKAWDVLDQSLKLDSDVIMFFQPSGYSISFSYENVGPELTITTQYSEQDFHKPYYKELGDVYVPIGCLIPWDKVPEGFEWEKYFQIQKEMKENTRKGTPEEIELCGEFNTKIGSNMDDYGHSDAEEGVFVYDREVLKKYADELLGSKKL